MRADGVSWRAYDRFMQTYVKRMGDERLTKLPPDLDLKPYRDEHDNDLLRRMAAAAADPAHPAHGDTALRRRLDKALAAHAAQAQAAKTVAKETRSRERRRPPAAKD